MAGSELATTEGVRGELVRQAREIFRRGFCQQFSDFFTVEEIGFIEGWFINQTLHKYDLRHNLVLVNVMKRGMMNLRFGAHIWILERLAEMNARGTEKKLRKQQEKGRRGVEKIIQNARKAEEVTNKFPQRMQEIEVWNNKVRKFFDDLAPKIDQAGDVVIAKPIEGALNLITMASVILGEAAALVIRAVWELVVENLRALLRL